MTNKPTEKVSDREKAPSSEVSEAGDKTARPVEIGGRKGPEPTRYGDWEKKGIISDF